MSHEDRFDADYDEQDEAWLAKWQGESADYSDDDEDDDEDLEDEDLEDDDDSEVGSFLDEDEEGILFTRAVADVIDSKIEQILDMFCEDMAEKNPGKNDSDLKLFIHSYKLEKAHLQEEIEMLLSPFMYMAELYLKTDHRRRDIIKAGIALTKINELYELDDEPDPNFFYESPAASLIENDLYHLRHDGKLPDEKLRAENALAAHFATEEMNILNFGLEFKNTTEPTRPLDDRCNMAFEAVRIYPLETKLCKAFAQAAPRDILEPLQKACSDFIASAPQKPRPRPENGRF